MHRSGVRALLALLLAGGASAASAATVDAFLARADALKAKGMAALFSPDVKLLQAEGMAAGKAWRAGLQAEKAAGRRPSACPPAKAKVTSTDLLDSLRALPPTERRLPLNDGFARVMNARYPCQGQAAPARSTAASPAR